MAAGLDVVVEGEQYPDGTAPAFDLDVGRESTGAKKPRAPDFAFVRFAYRLRRLTKDTRRLIGAERKGHFPDRVGP